MAEELIRIGVAGLGYWGPNLARNFAGGPAASCAGLRRVRGSSRAGRAQFPERAWRAHLQELLDDPELDAVVLATPVPTHADMRGESAGGRQALLRREAARAVGRRRRAAVAGRRAGRKS